MLMRRGLRWGAAMFGFDGFKLLELRAPLRSQLAKCAEERFLSG